MNAADTPGSFGPFRLEARASGVAVLWFDDPARKVNLLDSNALASLRRALDALKKRADASFPRALVLTSAKEGNFIAGADVNEFDTIASTADAEAKVKEAQTLFQEWSELPFPTVAAINGACLGGGTELALAMRYRIAADKGVTIGLPEVQLGILPGFGGTTRLPRLVGLVPAMSLLLTGRSLDPRRARKMGLIDDVLPAARFSERAVAWTEALLSSASPPRRAVPALPNRIMQSVPPFRSYALGQARQTVLRETKGHYPAPLEIVRVVGASWGKPIPEALKIERKAVAKLLFTPESENLRRIFQMNERAKRVPPADKARRVETAAVLGAGTMGGEIAYLMSMRDMRVRLRDIKPEPILKSLAHARSLFKREVSRYRLTRSGMEMAMGRIEPTLDLQGFRRVDLVLEAVVEDLNIKQSLFRELETQVGPECVFATNTSSLSVSAMARGLKHPERVVGMHFFNPATRMPLVEVIRADDTDAASLDTVVALARRLKKTPVIVADKPGFLVNRILMPYLAEAVGFVERGQSIPAIDKAARDFGMPMGPLELLDEIGMDIARKVAHVLLDAFGDRIPSLALIDKMVSEGALGKKTNLGFYRYERGRREGVNPALASLATSREPVPAAEIADRMVDAMVNEAALALDDRVVEDPADVDLSMILGTGFPPFRGGLLRHADAVGIGTIVERLARRQQAGAPYGPCGRLQRMALAGERFHEPRSQSRTGQPPSEAAAAGRR
ncbi:MAG TPA: 3-hydroxyacyl-CoA dehydrogenase NAD-binding domain-containing protein [Candidatus Eisenbacteria bacterium]|nr:3-hydroxyacyl-CoA dehydrogenase NAD-binding domain-containing protein [Candidatus Eisenbacteria bacterium]